MKSTLLTITVAFMLLVGRESAAQQFYVNSRVPARTETGNRGDTPANDDPCATPVDTLAAGEIIEWTGTLAGSDGEVWQVFHLETCANIVLDFCGSQPVYDNDYLYIMPGACDNFTDFLYVGLPNVTFCDDGNPASSFYALEPGTYFVSIYDIDGSAGDYNIAISASECAPQPANDNICDAQPQTLPADGSISFSGTLAGATPLEGYYFNEVWEAFTIEECASVTFNWCGSSTYFIASNSYVLSGDCSDLTTATYINPAVGLNNCDDGSSLHTAYNLEPGTYYVFIPDILFNQPDYTLTVSAGACVASPSNDNCATITPVTLSPGGAVTFNGSTIGATAAGDYGPDYEDELNPVVWHAFTISECSTVRAEFCATDPGFSYVLNTLVTECGLNTDYIFGTADYEQCPENPTITYYELAPGTYYMPVQQLYYENTTGDYSINVSAEECGPYCAAWAINTNPQYEKIDSISFAGISNSSTLGIGYENFLAVSTTVTRGSTYDLTISLSYPYPGDQAFAWIDYNQDYAFGEDELVFTSDTSSGPYPGSVTIPVDATLGTTRMRIRMHDTYEFHGPNATPCGAATYGQVEDYTLVIEDAIGIDHVGSTGLWSLYPNPGDGNFAVYNNGENALTTIEILDISGRLIYKEVENISGKASHNISPGNTLTPGVYMVRISAASKQNVIKVIVR